MKPRRETDIQLSIIHYLKVIGATVGKTKTLGVKRGKVYYADPYVMRGKADLECFWKGVMFAIEVKSEKGKLSEFQELYRESFHKPPDRIYILAYSLGDVLAVIN